MEEGDDDDDDETKSYWSRIRLVNWHNAHMDNQRRTIDLSRSMSGGWDRNEHEN